MADLVAANLNIAFEWGVQLVQNHPVSILSYVLLLAGFIYSSEDGIPFGAFRTIGGAVTHEQQIFTESQGQMDSDEPRLAIITDGAFEWDLSTSNSTGPILLDPSMVRSTSYTMTTPIVPILEVSASLPSLTINHTLPAAASISASGLLSVIIAAFQPLFSVQWANDYSDMRLLIFLMAGFALEASIMFFQYGLDPFVWRLSTRKAMSVRVLTLFAVMQIIGYAQDSLVLFFVSCTVQASLALLSLQKKLDTAQQQLVNRDIHIAFLEHKAATTVAVLEAMEVDGSDFEEAVLGIVRKKNNDVHACKSRLISKDKSINRLCSLVKTMEEEKTNMTLKLAASNADLHTTNRIVDRLHDQLAATQCRQIQQKFFFKWMTIARNRVAEAQRFQREYEARIAKETGNANMELLEYLLSERAVEETYDSAVSLHAIHQASSNLHIRISSLETQVKEAQTKVSALVLTRSLLSMRLVEKIHEVAVIVHRSSKTDKTNVALRRQLDTMNSANAALNRKLLRLDEQIDHDQTTLAQRDAQIADLNMHIASVLDETAQNENDMELVLQAKDNVIRTVQAGKYELQVLLERSRADFKLTKNKHVYELHQKDAKILELEVDVEYSKKKLAEEQHFKETLTHRLAKEEQVHQQKKAKLDRVHQPNGSYVKASAILDRISSDLKQQKADRDSFHEVKNIWEDRVRREEKDREDTITPKAECPKMRYRSSTRTMLGGGPKDAMTSMRQEDRHQEDGRDDRRDSVFEPGAPPANLTISAILGLPVDTSIAPPTLLASAHRPNIPVISLSDPNSNRMSFMDFCRQHDAKYGTPQKQPPLSRTPVGVGSLTRKSTSRSLTIATPSTPKRVPVASPPAVGSEVRNCKQLVKRVSLGRKGGKKDEKDEGSSE